MQSFLQLIAPGLGTYLWMQLYRKQHELFLLRDQIEQYVRKFTHEQQQQWVVKPIEKNILQPNF